MDLRFWKKKEERSVLEQDGTGLTDLLLAAGLIQDNISRIEALNIPTLAGCVELISSLVASIPIKLFNEENGKVKEIKDDLRIKLLNEETGDMLTSYEMKKALVIDYLLMGNGYIYINKERGEIVSLHYVKESDVSVINNVDPIFKNYDILIHGNTYKPYNFIKLLRHTDNGSEGYGIIEENPILLSVAYNSLKYENILSKTGGNKKGFIEAEGKLTEEAITNLKQQWSNMYSGNSENCVILNKGLTFKDSQATPTEMQMNQNKVANGEEICKIFNIPPSIIAGDGKANEGDFDKMFKMAILPILNGLIASINKDLLLEKEKKSFYFGYDATELLKGDIEKRFKAYEIAIKNKIMGVNEVRYKEDLKPNPLFEDTILLGLNDVLYNIKTGTVYTPNTDKTSDMKGGDNIEDRNKE
ncbi:phage portal protein [Clostridium tertium]|uniref:phage portal protein n=1 Tax=Clostridium tertium TaxID=1559 RepID=UPI00232D3D62|nr:phage portal protein [Clostridium tertium]MDB1924068.1 phage portal protein [Clostridium tertium]MDB1927171.1 phage portal protein [Clostridium tertium]MDB1930948.1 phage portal protein [Clostridium tertium]